MNPWNNGVRDAENGRPSNNQYGSGTKDWEEYNDGYREGQFTMRSLVIRERAYKEGFSNGKHNLYNNVYIQGSYNYDCYLQGFREGKKSIPQIKDKAEKFEEVDPEAGFYMLRDRWEYTHSQPEQWGKCWCGSGQLMNWCPCGARYRFVIIEDQRSTGPGWMAGYEQTTELEYRYRLTSTGYSSRRYGNCEICSEHCSEVFIQTENVRYNPRRGLRYDLHYDASMRDEGKPSGWTFYGCFNRLGHEECLLGERR